MTPLTIKSPLISLLGALSLALLTLVASFTFPTLESSYLLASLLTLLAVSVVIRRADPCDTPVVLLMIAPMAITLAAVSVLDGLDITLLGKGYDGESGLVVGMLLATLFVVRILTTRIRALPEKRFALLLLFLIFIALAPTYLLRISSSLYLTSTVTTIVCLVLLLPSIRRTMAGLLHWQRLLLSATGAYAIANGTAYYQSDSPQVALCVGLLWYLSVRYARNNEIPSYNWAWVGERLLVLTAIMVIIVSGVAPLCKLPVDVFLLPTWLVAVIPLLLSIGRSAEELPLLKCGVMLSAIGVATLLMLEMTEALPLDARALIRWLVASSLLALFVRCSYLRWRSGVRLKIDLNGHQNRRWMLAARASQVVNGLILAVAVTGFYLPSYLLIKNTSPTRLLANKADSWYWPGLPLFITLAMHDDYLYRDKLSWRWPENSVPGLLIKTIRRETPDHFSFFIPPDDDDSDSPQAKLRRKKKAVIGVDIRKSGKQRVIAFVIPKSPASKSGIERGDLLLAVNHQEYQKGKLCSNLGDKLLLTVQRLDGQTRDVQVTCAAPPASQSFARIIPTQKGPVGYMYISSFENRGFAGTSEAIELLAKQGVTDLVLDLRDNGGGKSYNEINLAGMLLGPKFSGRLLHRNKFESKYRDKNREVEVPSQKVALSLKQMVVITSEDTCSASELIINDLRPFITVRTIGSTTCGKPTMMDPIAIGTDSSGGELELLSATMSNAEGKGDYFTGITPDCPAKDNLKFNLGDTRENLLQGALSILANGTCPN